MSTSCDTKSYVFVKSFLVFRPVCAFFFFFQAEDGIRDYKVTGVQTCALPICPAISPDGKYVAFSVLHHMQERLPVLPDRECDILSIGGDRRAAKDSRSRTTPQLRVRPVGGLPDTLARAGRRNIQKIIWTQSWREPRAGRQRDSSRRRRLGG